MRVDDATAIILRGLGRESEALRRVNARIVAEGGRPRPPRREFLTDDEAAALEALGERVVSIDRPSFLVFGEPTE